MKTKPLSFLLSLTFLFLFSGSVFGQETEVEHKNQYKDGKKDGLWISRYPDGKKHEEEHYINGVEEGHWIRWLVHFWGGCFAYYLWFTQNPILH